MSKIHILDKLLSQYKLWTIKLRNASQNIEDNILQKDSSNKLQEKIMSIGISTILVSIITGIIGLFGIALGGIWTIVIFFIGWLLSKLINKKIFGSERKIEDIREDEQLLFKKIQNIESTHKKIRDEINDKSRVVNFIDYPNLKREFNELINLLVTYNTSNLALKYRYKHSTIVSKYKLEVNKFNKIYAHK